MPGSGHGTGAIHILLGPARIHGSERKVKRQIHLHNEHVLRLQEAITQRLEGKQRTLNQPWALTWLIPRQGFRSFQTAEYAKFSLHLHCGCYAKAEELQVQVKDYILANLGPEFKYELTPFFRCLIILSCRRGTMSLKCYNTKPSSRPKHTTVQIILQLCRSWMFLAPLA